MNIWSKALGPDVIPCLSLRQPWAWAVLSAGKTIENRKWSTSFRGVFLLHAASWPGDVEAMTKRAERAGCRSKALHNAVEEAQAMLDMAADAGAKLPKVTMRELYAERGGIVGVARLYDIIPPCRGTLFQCEHPWHMPEQYGFRLADIRRVPFTPWKGCLGFFGVPRDVAEPLLARAA